MLSKFKRYIFILGLSCEVNWIFVTVVETQMDFFGIISELPSESESQMLLTL